MCFFLQRTLRCLKYKDWLLLLSKTNYIVPAEYDRLESLCRELRITLISSINTTKGNIKFPEILSHKRLPDFSQILFTLHLHFVSYCIILGRTIIDEGDSDYEN